jgi:hypothetical protein
MTLKKTLLKRMKIGRKEADNISISYHATENGKL